MTVRDLHENISSTGVRIIGGDFAVKRLKRKIRVSGQNALTELKIQFELAAPKDPFSARTERLSSTEVQKFSFPFSDDKNCKFWFFGNL